MHIRYIIIYSSIYYVFILCTYTVVRFNFSELLDALYIAENNEYVHDHTFNTKQMQ